MDSFENPEFWRVRAAELSSLAALQNSELTGGKDHPKWLIGLVMYAGPDDQLGRSETQGGVDPLFRSRFDEIAGRSAIALGCPSGFNPIAFWLHCLWQDVITNHSQDADREVRRIVSVGGIVSDLLSSSEAYCLRLALLMERKLSQVKLGQAGALLRSDPNNNPGIASKATDTIYLGPVYFQSLLSGT
jgi:hypothetical protein